MLCFNNKDDISKMMKYHRTHDMINLLLYFPELSPIRDLTIIETIEEYKENYETFKNYSGERNDNPITKPMMVSVEGRGLNPDILSTFKRVKEIDKDGVMVIFNQTNTPCERYKKEAGLNIDVIIEYGIYIEAVGKGFDGREVSKGLDSHERYFIPWHEIRSLNINNFKDYRTFIISEEKYNQSRKERIRFLKSIDILAVDAESGVPNTYNEIPDYVWKEVIVKIIKKVKNREEEFKSLGFNEFVINANVENGKILAWQMFDKNRY